MRRKPDPYDFWAAYVMGGWTANALLVTTAFYFDPLEVLSWGLCATSAAFLFTALAHAWHRAKLRRADDGRGRDV
jgi:hypothetical protein